MSTQSGSERTEGIDPTIEGDDLSDTRLPEVVVKANTTKSPTRASEMLRTDAGTIEAGTVSLERSGAERITAERAVVSNSGVRSLDARSAQFDRSGVLALQADKVVLQESSAVSIVANEVRLVGTKALFVKAVTLSGDEASGVIVAAGSDGAVRPTVSSTGAAAFGVAIGLALVLLGRLVGGRRKSGGLAWER